MPRQRPNRELPATFPSASDLDALGRLQVDMARAAEPVVEAMRSVGEAANNMAALQVNYGTMDGRHSSCTIIDEVSDDGATMAVAAPDYPMAGVDFAAEFSAIHGERAAIAEGAGTPDRMPILTGRISPIDHLNIPSMKRKAKPLEMKVEDMLQLLFKHRHAVDIKIFMGEITLFDKHGKEMYSSLREREAKEKAEIAEAEKKFQTVGDAIDSLHASIDDFFDRATSAQAINTRGAALPYGASRWASGSAPMAARQINRQVHRENNLAYVQNRMYPTARMGRPSIEVPRIDAEMYWDGTFEIAQQIMEAVIRRGGMEGSLRNEPSATGLTGSYSMCFEGGLTLLCAGMVYIYSNGAVGISYESPF